jgi:hypothetical protein
VGGEASYITDQEYRRSEYDYFTGKEQPVNKEIRFRRIDNISLCLYGFSKLIKIDRLKKITVQTSFTRNEPIDIDSILIGDNHYRSNYTAKRQNLSTQNTSTSILPAIEFYGEGILFILDDHQLSRWERNVHVKERVALIREHAMGSKSHLHRLESKKLSSRQVLIHTLSHLLIREFEYVCGYPMSSMQERIYVGGGMNGFLISAYDGTNGYIGGLTKICNDLDALNEIILSALRRARIVHWILFVTRVRVRVLRI